MVYVEIDPKTDLPIRILRTTLEALKLPPERVRQMARSVAIGYIRQQVVDRARRNRLINCEFCGKVVTELTGHMHEVVPRGQGGEYSVDNSRYICPECHIGRDGEHGDRRFQSSKPRGSESLDK